MVCLYKHHLDWTQLDKLIFLRSSGNFAMKRLWTSHALHQSQGQDRNRLSEYRFPCLCIVRTDQFITGDNTASIITRRRQFNRLVQELYELPIVVWDGGEPALSGTSTLTLRVCPCQRNGRVQTCQDERGLLSSAGLSTGALIAILLCIVILLAIVVLFITLRRSKKEPLIISEEDVRENVVTYDDEGGGEEDTEAFDIITLRNPAAAEEFKFRRDIRPEAARQHGQNRGHHSPPELNQVDVQEFIKQRLVEADMDTNGPPYDSLQTYAYEGQMSPTGSISSLDSPGTHSEQDYNYLDDWGPEFQKLAELYGEDTDVAESDVAVAVTVAT